MLPSFSSYLYFLYPFLSLHSYISVSFSFFETLSLSFSSLFSPGYPLPLRLHIFRATLSLWCVNQRAVVDGTNVIDDTSTILHTCIFSINESAILTKTPSDISDSSNLKSSLHTSTGDLAPKPRASARWENVNLVHANFWTVHAFGIRYLPGSKHCSAKQTLLYRIDRERTKNDRAREKPRERAREGHTTASFSASSRRVTTHSKLSRLFRNPLKRSKFFLSFGEK